MQTGARTKKAQDIQQRTLRGGSDQCPNRVEHADLEGGGAKLWLIDRAKGEEGPGAEARQSVGKEEQPAAAVDLDASFRLVAARLRRPEAIGAGGQHTDIS